MAPTREELESRIMLTIRKLLSRIEDGKLTGRYSVEIQANQGGVLPDSLKTMEAKRLS